MKTILAPTDFSGIAKNSINYAIELAKATKAKVILLHACSPTVVVAEIPMELPDIKAMEKEGLNKLKKLRSALLSKHGNGVNIDLVCKTGLAFDIIKDYSTEKKVDLIVMGMHGVGFLEEKLIGNVTSELIKRSDVPVLSIDNRVRFQGVKRIVFAADYKELNDEKTLNVLKNIAGVFQSHIYILNAVKNTRELPSTNQAVAGVRLNNFFSNVDHSFHTEVNSDVVNGIQKFVSARKMEMIVMMPRKRTFFQALHKTRNTKEIAFYTKTPLLTVHD